MLGFAPEYLHLLGVRGLAGAAVAKLRRRPVTCRIRRPFLTHDVFLRIPSSDVISFRQVFETHDYDLTVCRPPRAIVDAGANIGLTSICLAQRFPEARIIAVEPEAQNFAALARNVAAFPSVVPIRAAIWHENTEVGVYDPGIGHWGYRVGAADVPYSQRRGRVRAITIDRLMLEHDLPRLDVLKVDIEGSEREVLADPDRWIDAVDALVVELHDHVRPGCDASFVAIRQRFAHSWQRGELQYLAREGSAVVGPPA